MRIGDQVTFTMDHLGVIGGEEIVMAGDKGTYLGTHPMLDEGWFLIEPDKFPRKLVPVSLDMISPVSRHADEEVTPS